MSDETRSEATVTDGTAAAIPVQITKDEAPDAGQATAKAGAAPAEEPRTGSLWSDAWHDLRRSPVFIGSGLVVVLLLVIAAFPQLFASQDPNAAGFCDLKNSLKKPSGDHWFGYDLQGCDIYTRTIWATRNSVVVGFVTVTLVTVVGGLLGLIAGYVGGWVDGLLSRFTDIFFAIPLMLGGILALTAFGGGDALSVALVMSALGWPRVFRIMRGSVISNKHHDYVVAARALGGGTLRVALRHILPNALAPVIVVVTIGLGEYIAAEAALSFLGIGIQSPEISWGLMISDARDRYLQASHPLLFPSLFLSLTVLSFILMGDAVRNALDPKMR